MRWLGVPILLLTGWAMYYTAALVDEHRQLAQWPMVNGVLDKISVVAYGKGSRKLSGQYRYNYRGQAYSTSHIGYRTSLNYRLWRRLEQTAKPGYVPVFVNPQNPREAYLDRPFPWKAFGHRLLFSLAGLLAGLGLLFYRGKRSELRQRDSEFSSVMGMGSFVWAYNGVFAPHVLNLLPWMLFEGQWVILFQVVMALIGLFLLFSWAQMLVSLIRFGPVVLELKSAGKIGGFLQGRVTHRPQRRVPDKPLELKLSCRRVYRKHKETLATYKFKSEPPLRRSDFYEYRFRTPLPDTGKLLPSGKMENRATIHWRLEIQSQTLKKKGNDSQSKRWFRRRVGGRIHCELEVPVQRECRLPH